MMNKESAIEVAIAMMSETGRCHVVRREYRRPPEQDIYRAVPRYRVGREGIEPLRDYEIFGPVIRESL